MKAALKSLVPKAAAAGGAAGLLVGAAEPEETVSEGEEEEQIEEARELPERVSSVMRRHAPEMEESLPERVSGAYRRHFAEMAGKDIAEGQEEEANARDERAAKMHAAIGKIKSSMPKGIPEGKLERMVRKYKEERRRKDIDVDRAINKLLKKGI